MLVRVAALFVAFAWLAATSAQAQIIPSTTATRLEAASPLNVAVQYGDHVTMLVKTLDSGGQAIGGQGVLLSATCGSLNPISTFSDPSGLAFIGWNAPSGPVPSGVCFITVVLNSGSAALTFGAYLPGTPVPPPGAQVLGSSPNGGKILVSMTSTDISCGFGGAGTLLASFGDSRPSSLPAPLPVEGATPHGTVSVNVRTCGSTSKATTFMIDLPSAVPPTAQWWSYGPSPDNSVAHWYPIPADIAGNRVSFSLTNGGYGDTDGKGGPSVSNFGMLVIPGGEMQDLWWSGVAENGWGMTIVQHRDVLFANMFVYDAQGNPTWYVMPSGTWNADHTAYTGSLYLPKGSPYFAYDVSKFQIGASVGTATITFAGLNSATFQYTINGTSGSKVITRLPFGPKDAPLDRPWGDLWWAGLAQNGWGLVLSQQYSTLFGLWFTYDANGKATWFVMPNVDFVFRDTYRGNIYRPEGPAWLGVPYDPTRHRTVQVGTFTLRFSGDGATFDYTIDGKSGSVPISRIPF